MVDTCGLSKIQALFRTFYNFILICLLRSSSGRNSENGIVGLVICQVNFSIHIVPGKGDLAQERNQEEAKEIQKNKVEGGEAGRGLVPRGARSARQP